MALDLLANLRSQIVNFLAEKNTHALNSNGIVGYLDVQVEVCKSTVNRKNLLIKGVY